MVSRMAEQAYRQVVAAGLSHLVMESGWPILVVVLIFSSQIGHATSKIRDQRLTEDRTNHSTSGIFESNSPV